MDIGEEGPAIVIEPAEQPVPRPVEEPAPPEPAEIPVPAEAPPPADPDKVEAPA